ncbi:MAG: helix-hairpin-helix domain-containing protein [Prevotellaceae bacterium]|jgi:hypothetical protein|nr:helix-hairpin-helix domain-containing protein [Prevotellaceae bacterium]
MSIHRTLVGLMLALAAPAQAAAQGDAAQLAIAHIVEKIATLEDADASLDMVYETLTAYALNPLNLNTASVAELMQLCVLNEFQAESVLEYIAQYGEMQTPYELQFVQGITQEMMMLMLPFVATQPREANAQPTLRQMLTGGQHRVLMRARQTLEQARGYREGQYLGSPQSLYARYRYTFRDRVQWGFTADKDAGEPFGGAQNKAGFDFYSGHVQASKIGRLRNIVVGDYYAQFGQGLLLWQGGSFGKSSDAFSIAKQGSGVRAYSGADENRFFRGLAASLDVARNLRATAFFSYKNIDANADTTGVFSTLQTSGLHNTASTMAGKNTVSEMVAGGNVSYSFRKLRIGVSGLWHSFGGDYQHNPAPYRYFELSKNTNANLSADYRWYVRRAHLFGEVGLSQNGGLATLNGCAADVAPRLQLVALHRYYQPQYQAYYANAFAEGGKTANENGFYLGANITPHAKVKASLYFDASSFEWLRFRAMSPSRGFDFLLQTAYAATRSCSMYVRLRYDNKQENMPADAQPTRAVGSLEKLHLRYNIGYQLVDGLRCETRVEAASSQAEGGTREYGAMAFQSLQYSWQQLSFSLRYAMFNTSSFATAIYAYENDAAYAFSVPAYYGQGSRWYVNLCWQPVEQLDIWLRCAQTTHFDRDTIGDGAAQIAADHQTEVKLQVMVKF